MATKYAPPEGYYYDWWASEYYRKEREFDEKDGKPVLALYIFQPMEGTLKKYTYPIDPVSGKPILGEAQIPKEMAPFLQKLRKYPTQMTKMAMLAASGISFVFFLIVLAVLSAF